MVMCPLVIKRLPLSLKCILWTAKIPLSLPPPPSLAQHASFVRTCMVPVNSNNFFLFQR